MHEFLNILSFRCCFRVFNHLHLLPSTLFVQKSENSSDAILSPSPSVWALQNWLLTTN